MAGYRRIQTGGSDRIATAPLHAGNPAVPLTALATVVVSIWRVRLGVVQWYDFNDATFKAVGWTTLQQAMTVVDATRAPGVYQYLWDTSAITNPEADDSYYYFATDTSATAKNIPQEGQLDVGQYVDDIDAAISSRAIPGDAMDLVTDAVDANAVAATGVAEIQAGLATSAEVAAVQADTDDLQTRVPAALVGGRMDSSVGAMAAGVLTAAAVATDAIDADALAADAVAEIQAGLATSAALAAVQADTDDIQTRLPATLNAGRMRSHVEAIDAGTITAVQAPNLDAAVSSRAAPGDAMDLVANAVDAAAIATGAIDADALATDAVAEIADGVWDEPVAGHLATGTFGRYVGRVVAAETAAAAGSSPTEIRTGLTQADDFFNNMQVVVINAAGIAVRNVDDYANLNGAITVTALPFTPALGDVVLVLARTGSVPVNTSAIATAVWDEALPGAHAAGSAGERLATTDDRVDAAITTRAAPGDAMDLVADAVDAAAVAGSAVTEIQAGLATAAALAAVQVDTDDIQTRLPATLNAGRMRSHVEAMDAGTVTAAVIATDAIDADALAADAVAEIADGVWDEGLAGHLAPGSTGEALATAAAGGSPAAIATAVWDEALPGAHVAGTAGERLATTDDRVDVAVSTRAAPGDAMDLVNDAVDAAAIALDAIDANALAASAIAEIQAGLATASAVATVQLDTNDIQARLPASLSGGRMRSQVEGMDAGTVDAAAIATGAIDADALAADAVAEIADGVWDEGVAGHLAAGTFGRYVGRVVAAETAAAAGSTSTEIRTGLTQADDFFNDMQVVIINAAGIAARNIADFANINGAITVSPALPFVPAVGDAVFILSRVGAVPTDTGAIADAVWDEALAGHLAPGSTGEALDAAASGSSPAVVAAAVWDEARAGHVAGGSFGETVRVTPAGAPNLDAAVSTRAVPGDAMDLVANAVDAAAIATDAIDADALAASAIAEIQAGLATSAALAAVQADTDNIQTRLPATLVGGRMRSHVEAMDADVIGAAQIAAGAITAVESPPLANLDAAVSTRAVPGDAMDLVAGAVDAAAIATDAIDADALAPSAIAEIQAGLATAAALAVVQADTDDLQTRVPASLSGGRMRSAVESMAPDTLTASALAADAVAEIADGVWDEGLAGHLAPGSTGEALANAATAPSPAVIAVAVWDEALPGAHAAGTAGERLATTDNRVDVAVSTRAQASVRVVASFAYNPTTNTLDGNVWLERDGVLDTTAATATVAFYSSAGVLLFPALVDLTPDAQGFFRVTQASPAGFTQGAEIYMVASIDAPSGTYTTGKGIQVVG